jgi:hypothetical protein
MQQQGHNERRDAMTIGKEIPFRRSRHDRDTGSLVFDHERKAAHAEPRGEAEAAMRRKTAAMND